MKKRILILIIAVALAISTIVLVTQHSKSTTISQKINAPSRASSITAFNPNTFVYSNGDNLMELNYSTGEVKAVSPNVGPSALQSLDTLSVSQDKKHILFHTTGVTPGSALEGTLRQLKLDTSSDYWWVLTVQTKELKPLPVSALLAKMDNDKVYALVANPDGESIIQYDLATIKQESSFKILPSSDFYVIKDGFLLQTTENKVYFTNNGTVNKEVLSETNLVGITPDHQEAVAAKIDKKGRSLITVNLQNYSTKTVADKVFGDTVWLGDGIVLYNTSTESTKLSTYNAVAHETTHWKLTESAAVEKRTALKPVALLDGTTAVVRDDSNTNYLIGNNLHFFIDQ